MGLYDRDYMRSRPVSNETSSYRRGKNPNTNSLSGLAWFPKIIVSAGGMFLIALFCARVGGFFEIISTPWIHENRNWFFFLMGYPDAFVLAIAIGAIGTTFDKNKGMKNLAVFIIAGIGFISLGLYFFPDLISTKTFWRGENWEPAYGYALQEGKKITKPKGQMVYLVNNPNAKNPTFAELMDFLAKDKTDAKGYVAGEFVCSSFAELLHNNAEKNNFRCGFVSVDFRARGVSIKDTNGRVVGEIPGFGVSNEDPRGHALNVFKTTDKGLIFIDSTGFPLKQNPDFPLGFSDRSVDLEVGKSYLPKYLLLKQYKSTEMGIVKTYQITW